MNPDGTQDINFSCFGADGHLRPDGTIDPAKQYSDLVFDPRLTGQDPANFSDIWKLSRAVGYTFENCRSVDGGQQKEDGLDINNHSCMNLFIGGEIECGHGVAITCKGESSYNKWRDVLIRGRGKHCEIEFGNWSDQGYGICQGNVLENIRHEDGKPVRVAFGRSEKPIIIGGNCEIVWCWSVALKIYTFGKHTFPSLIK